MHSSLTNFRTFPEPDILTIERKHKGPLQDPFRAQVPVRKGKTAILTSRQQPTGLHRSFRAAGPLSEHEIEMTGEFLDAQREQAGDSSTEEKTIFRLTF